MAESKFSASDKISLSEGYLFKLIDGLAKAKNFKHWKILSNSSTEKGDGFVGLINFVRICAVTPDDQDISLDVVVKSCPKSDKLRSGTPIVEAFRVENYFYSTIYPVFHKFQAYYNLEDPFESAAQCFYTTNQNYQEGLVLENLRATGFSLWDRKKPMDNKHITLVLKEYAKFHSISLAMRCLKKPAFQELKSGLENKNFIDFLKLSKEMLLNQYDHVVQSFDDTEGAIKENAKKFRNGLLQFILEESAGTDEYSVMCHGDCWSNNMMFKYNGRNSPIQMRFLDWQLSRLSSLVLDVSFFFYCCSSEDIINDLDHYLCTYYETLSIQLRRFGCKSCEVFPKSVFEDHWKRFSKFGLILALPTVKIMLSEKEESPDLSDSAETSDNVIDSFNFRSKNEEEYLERLRGIVRHFVVRGYL